jgi:two-component system NtrC family sensor kinase
MPLSRLGGSGVSADLLASAFDQSALASLLVDADRIIVYVNPSLEAIVAYRAGALIGQEFKVLFGDQFTESQYEELWTRMRVDGMWQGQVSCRTRNSTLKQLEIIMSAVRADGGAPRYYLAVFRDMMEDSEHAVQVRQSQKFEAIGQLASGIAHEINTPTQYIGDNLQFFQDSFGGIVGLLRKYESLYQCVEAGGSAANLLSEIRALRDEIDLEFLLEETPDAIERSLEGNRRVAEVVRAMKEFAHPSAENPVLTNLNRGIESTISVSRNEWKYVATIDTIFAPDMPLVPCVPGAFNQVVLNIVVNAAHAIAEATNDGALGKGVITITTGFDSDWAIVRISDTGKGIPEHIGSRIFNPFFTTKPVGKGTGQGLAIARSVVEELHRGTLSFESETGKGTTFEIQIPLRWPEDSQKEWD